jgi:hypothetical protein
LPSSSIGWLPPFCWWFSFKDGSCFGLRDIYFYFDSFSTSFI